MFSQYHFESAYFQGFFMWGNKLGFMADKFGKCYGQYLIVLFA